MTANKETLLSIEDAVILREIINGRMKERYYRIGQYPENCIEVTNKSNKKGYAKIAMIHESVLILASAEGAIIRNDELNVAIIGGRIRIPIKKVI